MGEICIGNMHIIVFGTGCDGLFMALLCIKYVGSRALIKLYYKVGTGKIRYNSSSSRVSKGRKGNLVICKLTCRTGKYTNDN